jgi:hypothetical protein
LFTADNPDSFGNMESVMEDILEREKKEDREVREEKEESGEKASADSGIKVGEGSCGMRRRGSTESVSNSYSNSNSNSNSNNSNSDIANNSSISTEHNITARNRILADPRSATLDEAIRPKDAVRRNSNNNSNMKGKGRESMKEKERDTGTGTGPRKMRISYLPHNSPLKTLRRASNALSPPDSAAGEDLGSLVLVLQCTFSHILYCVALSCIVSFCFASFCYI